MAAVASVLQIVVRVRFGMRGRYIGQLPRRRGRLTAREEGVADYRPWDGAVRVGRMAIV
ncbi:hypothetical protein GCM10010378_37870 [Streptomyces viridochromogenes]